MASDPRSLSLYQIKTVLEYAMLELGVKDMYNSDTGFISKNMTPVGDGQSTPGWGHMKRDDRDICLAASIPGQVIFEGPAATPQVFDEGCILVKQGESLRGVQPNIFFRTYKRADGRAIRAEELPQLA